MNARERLQKIGYTRGSECEKAVSVVLHYLNTAESSLIPECCLETAKSFVRCYEKFLGARARKSPSLTLMSQAIDDAQLTIGRAA